MTKREIRKLAQQKIKEGKTQQLTFEEINDISDSKAEDIADIVKNIPVLQLRQKYKSLNNILILILILTALFMLFSDIADIQKNEMKWRWFAFMLIAPIIHIVLIWFVANFKPNAHRITAMYALIGFPRIINHFDEDPYFIIHILILGAIVSLAFYLQLKLTPGYSFFREKFTNNEGVLKLRTFIVFKDSSYKCKS